MTKSKLDVLLFALEDDEADLIRLRRILEESIVAEFQMFDNKHKFLEKFHKHVHIAIIDHSLDDDTTGLEIMQRVLEINRLCYVIIVSGNRNPNLVIEYFHEGARKYVFKDDPKFEEKLKSYINKAYQKFEDIIAFFEDQQSVANSIETKRGNCYENMERVT